MPPPSPVVQKITEISQQLGIDPNVALGIAQRESGLRQTDDRGRMVLGSPTPKGRAEGVMQVMPYTAKRFGLNAADLEGNIRAGLMDLKSKLTADAGNMAQALANYQGRRSPNASDRKVASGGNMAPQAASGAFDVDGARQAGYSDDEILQHLTATRNFDVNNAVKSGYSKQEVISYLAGQANRPDPITQQMNATAKAAGVSNPGVSQPATNPIQQAYLQTLDPQQRYLQSLPDEQRPQAEKRLAAGSSMAIPAGLAMAGMSAPIATIGKQGLVQGAKSIGLGLVRRGVGTAGGAFMGGEAGKYAAPHIGLDPETGEQIGSLAGGAIGGIAGNKPAFLSKIPWGRALVTEDEAANLAVSKRLAMQRAIANNPDMQQQELGKFMNSGYKSDITPPPEPTPTPFANTPPPEPQGFAPKAASNRFEEIMQQQSAQRALPGQEAGPGQNPTDAAALRKSLSPTIYESEAQANQLDATKQRLANEAKWGGVYSAARGSTKTPLNYQQRIGAKLPWMQSDQ